jgi:enoyl-CoA hydratase/carnithine racemase
VSGAGLSVEDRGRLRLVWLDRPPRRNALTLELIITLHETLDAAMADAGIDGVALLGRGPHFSAGVDLTEMAGASEAGILRLINALRELCASARRAPKPVVAAVQGGCVGGAFELAMAADLRVASEDAWFALPEVRVGMPSVIDAALLVHHVGLGRAREVLLTGDRVEARRAFDWGLVNVLVPEPGALVEAAAALVARVSVNHPGAVALQKVLIEEWLNLGLDEAIERSTVALGRAFATGVPQRLCAERLGGSSSSSTTT